MFESRNNTNLARTPNSPLLKWAVLLVGLAFFATEQRLLISQEGFSSNAIRMAESTQSGNLVRQLAFTSLAVLGAACLIWKAGPRFRIDPKLAAVMSAFLACCLASILWTSDVGLTIRRSIVLMFCFVGALGLSRQLSARELGLLVLVVSGAYGFGGIVVELALGTFQPWRGDYRYCGTAHPNLQGLYCAAACITAVCFAHRDHPRRKMLLIVAGIAFTLLLLTKSRSSCIACAAALLTLWMLRTTWTSRLSAALSLTWATCLALLMIHLGGFVVGDRVADALLLGRSEHAGTLTGRVPLWFELLGYIEHRSLLGYGYGAFWTPDRIEEISSRLYYGFSEAHSAYLETILSIGIVGAAALLMTLLLAVFRATSLHRATNDAGCAFIVCLAVIALVHSLVESTFARPYFMSFALVCGCTHLAFWGLKSSRIERPAPQTRAPATWLNPRWELSGP